MGRLLSTISVLVLIASCGKEAKKVEDRVNDRAPERRASFPELADNQKVVCENILECPEYVAKVTVISENSIRYCTGTLIDDDKIVTSAQCLNKNMRVPHIRCDENVFFAFPQSAFSPAKRVACDKILFADRNVYQDPALWRNDIVVFKLKEKVGRHYPFITRRGVENSSETYVWKIDYKDELVGTLKKVSCDSMIKNYLIPYGKDGYTPVFTAGNCNLKEEGNTGAPILKDGKLIGVYSLPIRDRLVNFLKAKKLIGRSQSMDYFYFSNVACSRYSGLGGYGAPRSCRKKISLRKLDSLRASFIEGNDIHGANLASIKRELEAPERYFLWSAEPKKIRDGEFAITMGKPKCIYKSSEWINEFRASRRSIYNVGTVTVVWPDYRLRTKLNKYLIADSFIEKEGVKEFDITFNPYSAYVKGHTDAQIVDKFDYTTEEEDYTNIRACQ